MKMNRVVRYLVACLVAILFLFLIVMFVSCSRPKMVGSPQIEGEVKLLMPAEYAVSLNQDPKEKLIKEHAELIKLYEAKIKELEIKLNGGGK